MAIPGIHEIQTLATKYSKAQLQKMAQMGLIDSTKAVMAGMMIDRISKQNMAPPATTVAEDALAPPAPQGPPQGQPQGAPQGQPQMGPSGAPPEQSAGVAGLPSNIPEMAGGGIVAFADGGDVPGYADGKLIDMRTDPARKISAKTQNLRDEERYQILAEELRDEQAKEASASGVEKISHKKNIEALQREMRTIKLAPSASNLPVSSAAASTLPANPIAPVPAKPNAPASQDTGDYFKDPFGAPDYTTEGFNLKQRIEPGKPYEPTIQGQVFGYERGILPPIVEPKTAPSVSAGPETFQPRTDVAPPAEPVMPRERGERGAPEDLTRIEAEQIAVPEATSLGAERARREEAYKEAGVDTNMYKELMAEVASRKEGGAKKREQALGMALMMTGLGLAGARRGQEFQALSGAGRQALAQFQGAMDNIVANEDKLDNMVRELKMAENNYKRTGAESDLARVRAREDKIEAINVKNTELRNAANLESQKLAVTKYGYGKPTAVVEAVNEILKDMPPGTPFIKGLEAYNLSQNINKPQNKLSYEEAAKIVSADVTIPAKDKPAAIEAMLRHAQSLQGGASGGGGSLIPGKDGSFNYVPGGTK
jgi:hypothetical protein